MATLTVIGNGFAPRTPSTLTVGSVNADPVVFVVDGSWTDLTVFAAFRNDTEGVERHVLLGDDLTCTVPWECLTQPGTLNVGLLGLRGADVVKPTIWMQFGRVAQGVNSEGEEPGEPTETALQQVVQIAQSVREDADNGLFDGAPGKSPIIKEGNWWVWDDDLQDYKDTGVYSGGDAPYIGENGNWFVGKVDTGVVARGYSPVKGVDYWTETDRQEIINEAKTDLQPQVDAATSAANKAAQEAQKAQQAVESIGTSVEEAKQAKDEAVAAVESIGTSVSDAQNAAQQSIDAKNETAGYLETVEGNANKAQQAADDAELSKQAAEQAKQSAADSASDAEEAKNTAVQSVAGIGESVQRAEQAATDAEAAETNAAQSAENASGSASAAQTAKEAAEAAAAVLPSPTPDDAGKALVVNKEGNGYIFGEASAGGAGGELLLAEYVHQGNQEIHFTSFDWETGIGECTEPHGLVEGTQILIVPNDWWTQNFAYIVNCIPYEWLTYDGILYAVPLDETHVVLSSKKTEQAPVVVDVSGNFNASIDYSKFHFEVHTQFSIKNFPVNPSAIHVTIVGFMSVFDYNGLSVPYVFRNGKTSAVNLYLAKAVKIQGYPSPRHSVFQIMDISLYPSGGGGVTIVDMKYRLDGALNAQGLALTAQSSTIEKHIDTAYFAPNSGDNSGFSHFSGFGSFLRNIYSNHTIFRVYAKEVLQE